MNYKIDMNAKIISKLESERKLTRDKWGALIQSGIQGANKLTRGLAGQLPYDPSYEPKTTRAGLGILETMEQNTGDNPYPTLLFQYNPEEFEEVHRLQWRTQHDIAGDNFITSFTKRMPIVININFVLDAYEQVFSLSPIERQALGGLIQGGMTFLDKGDGGIGSTGQSSLAMLQQKAVEHFPDKAPDWAKDNRSLDNALTNLKRFTHVKSLYSYEHEGKTVTRTVDERASLTPDTDPYWQTSVLTHTQKPPLCVLNWGKMLDFKCVVKEMNLKHLLFNPTTLQPIRTIVSMQLEEFSDVANVFFKQKDGGTPQGN